MTQTVELSSFDLRYEPYRLRDDAQQARLLASLAERGIEQPLEGVDTPEGRLLLNGFKRYRCAKRLDIHCVPYVSLGSDEASGILCLMRAAKDKTLSILEQAKFVVDLLTVHQMSVVEVAQMLSRSTAWVSMRRNLLEELSDSMQTLLFRGDFPVYCYMYALRKFMRIKESRDRVTREQIEQFMKTVGGKKLSVRDIDLLAEGYFRGPESLKKAIDDGKLGWSLEQMKNIPQDEEGCTEPERMFLQEMQRLQKLMQRVTVKRQSSQFKSRAFFAQANLLAGGLLAHVEPFQEGMKEFYDRSGHA